jgi:hypothetical protein
MTNPGNHDLCLCLRCCRTSTQYGPDGRKFGYMAVMLFVQSICNVSVAAFGKAKEYVLKFADFETFSIHNG